MPNNRQWALLFWIVVFFVWALSRRDIRASVLDVLRVARSPKLLMPAGGMVAWVALEIWAGARLGLWRTALTADTVQWFIVGGLVLYGKFTDVANQPGFFRRKARAAIALSALAESYTELAVFSLPIELLIQPVVTLIAGVGIVAEMKQEHRPVKRLADGCLTVFGLAVLTFVAVRLIADWGELDKDGLVLQLALPVWLTVGLLPYVYVVGLVASYEIAFLHTEWKTTATWWSRLRARLVMLTSFHLRATEVGAFAGHWPRHLAAAQSFREGRRVIRDFRQTRADEARTKAEADTRLKRFAGVAGADEDGRRLDQREFLETKNALRWLASCQMGWYHNDGRYRLDLLEAIGDDLFGPGLPRPTGIAMSVSRDGQTWFAWRRTISGWCFAIGADGPPSDQWEYDGPEPPEGFPGRDPAWGSAPFGVGDANRNW